MASCWGAPSRGVPGLQGCVRDCLVALQGPHTVTLRCRVGWASCVQGASSPPVSQARSCRQEARFSWAPESLAWHLEKEK